MACFLRLQNKTHISIHEGLSSFFGKKSKTYALFATFWQKNQNTREYRSNVMLFLVKKACKIHPKSRKKWFCEWKCALSSRCKLLYFCYFLTRIWKYDGIVANNRQILSTYWSEKPEITAKIRETRNKNPIREKNARKPIKYSRLAPQKCPKKCPQKAPPDVPPNVPSTRPSGAS